MPFVRFRMMRSSLFLFGVPAGGGPPPSGSERPALSGTLPRYRSASTFSSGIGAVLGLCYQDVRYAMSRHAKSSLFCSCRVVELRAWAQRARRRVTWIKPVGELRAAVTVSKTCVLQPSARIDLQSRLSPALKELWALTSPVSSRYRRFPKSCLTAGVMSAPLDTAWSGPAP